MRSGPVFGPCPPFGAPMRTPLALFSLLAACGSDYSAAGLADWAALFPAVLGAADRADDLGLLSVLGALSLRRSLVHTR